VRPFRRSRPRYVKLCALIGVFSLVAALVVVVAGCKSTPHHTSDPQLRQIDQLIAKQLPPGSSESQVNFFLNSRGYPQEDSHQAHVLIATIEHVDTETLQPAAARVTFRFDNNDKLLTYELTAVAPSTPH